MSNTFDYAFFIGWNRPVAGREFDTIEAYGGFAKYLDTQVENGTIGSHESYMLDQHGGDLNGFWLIRGDRTKLEELSQSEDWMRWVAKGVYTFEGFGVLRACTGNALQTRMTHYQNVIKK